MAELTREQALNILQNDWMTYVERFQRFSPETQAEFLTRQGYNSLTDLLAHILAWWEDGQRVIVCLCNDSSFVPPDYDVDAFNAQAVERFRQWTELDIIKSFDQTRAGWLNFIDSLPTNAFQNQQIVHRLYLELVYHMQEHLLPSDASV